MLVLVAVTLLILLIAASFSVDIAYMQLARTELRAATDAAARAGAEALSREQSTTAAIKAAKRIARHGQRVFSTSPNHLSSMANRGTPGNAAIAKVPLPFRSDGRWHLLVSPAASKH